MVELPFQLFLYVGKNRFNKEKALFSIDALCTDEL